MIRYFTALILKVILVAMPLALLSFGSEMATVFQKVERFDESDLANAIATPEIYAFDLSASGRTIALLARSGDLADAANWLLIVDLKSAHVLQKLQVSQSVHSSELSALSAYFPPQVAFTPDEKLLVIQEQGQVSVVDVATLHIVRKLEAQNTGTNVAISICGSTGNNLFAISFLTGERPQSQFERIPVRVEIFDVSDGSRHGSWDSDDIPQSLSPDGRLAAVSDHRAGGTLLELAVIETSSGSRVATLDGGFKFGKPEGGQTIGRVVGKFLSNKEIVLSPDSNFDRSGHYSGENLRIVKIPDGSIVQALGTKQFGPTGEVEISDNGERIVTASWYLNPSFLTNPHETMQAGSTPELIIFSNKGGDYRLEGSIKSAGGGLRVGGAALVFRTSSDGSVVGVAENHGITVFVKHE